MAPKRRIKFLETPFDLIDRAQVLEYIVDNKRNSFSYVVTPNADHVVRLNKSKNIYGAYSSAAISVCDSQVVALLAKLKGVSLGEVVTGSDLTRELFDNMIGPGSSVCIIGLEPASVVKIKQLYNLSTVSHYNPPMGFVNDSSEIEKCCDFVISNPSEFIFIAVGSPQQEIVAKRLYDRGGAVGVGLCIGASLLFLTGEERRAPKIVSSIKLEWLFRLSQSPKRLWKRYLGNMMIFMLAAKSDRGGTPH